MRALFTDAHARLIRAVREAIAADLWIGRWLLCDPLDPGAGPSLVIEDFASEPWASLTFAGMRHQLDIRLRGTIQDVETAYDRLLAVMVEPDIMIPGHFLADVQLVESIAEIRPDGGMDLAIQFEALTIEE